MDWLVRTCVAARNGFNKLGTRQPNDNHGTLIGWKQISQYTGLCVSTLIRYTRSDGFPACHLPDNRMFTTKTLVDQWIMARMTIEQGLADPVDNSVDKSESGN